VRHLVRRFGPDRLMWGSDWPVLELRAGYADWLDMAARLSGLGGEGLEQLRHGVARRFYRI
jgi:L-fuconolactonase